MKAMRTEFNAALRGLAEAAGYTFYADFIANLNAKVMTLPALYLQPLECISVQGREYGRIDYAVTMYLLATNEVHTEAEKAATWDLLESDALAMLRALYPDWVISDIRVTPDEMITQYGELSVEVKCNVNAEFCNG